MSSTAQKVIVVPVLSPARAGGPARAGRPGRRAEGLPPEVAAVLDLDDQPGRQRVDDRDADAVQAAGDLVAAAAELAAGVQHGQRHVDRRQLLARGGVGGDAAAVVDDPDAAVGEQRHHDPVAVAGERLVDRVVDDLGDQVVQAALAGRADVHAGALADRLEALEHLDRGGVVVAVVVAREVGAGLARHLRRGVRLLVVGGVVGGGRVLAHAAPLHAADNDCVHDTGRGACRLTGLATRRP